MATGMGFRRILYTSVPAGTHFEADRLAIVEQSQRANGMDGITGVLWSAQDLYIQVIEGPPDVVEETFARICDDVRHHSINVIADGIEADRLFGAWAMTGLWNSPSPVLTERLRGLIRASDDPQGEELVARLTE